MTRNRYKKSKTIGPTHASSDVKRGNSSNCHESQTDDATDYRREIRRAWKSFLAVATEFSLCKLDGDIDKEWANLETTYLCEKTSRHAILGLGAYQIGILDRIDLLTIAKEDIENHFIDSLLRLDGGEPFHKLLAIDPEFSLAAIQARMQHKYSIDLDVCDVNIAAQRASPDSAVFEVTSDSWKDQSDSPEDSSSDQLDVVGGSLHQSDVTESSEQAASDEVAWQDNGDVTRADSSLSIDQVDVFVTADAVHGERVGQDHNATTGEISHQGNPSTEQLDVVVVGGDADNGDGDCEDVNEPKTEADLILELLRPDPEEIASSETSYALPSHTSFSINDQPVGAAAVDENLDQGHVTEADLMPHSGIDWPPVSDEPNFTPTLTTPFVDVVTAGNCADEAEGWEKVTKKKVKSWRKLEDQLAFPNMSTDVQASPLCLDYLNTKSCKHEKDCKFQHVYDPKRTVKPKDKQMQSAEVNAPAAVAVSTPMENGLFQGEIGSLRRKTEMCRNFQIGVCGWGELCNYAHSKAELTAAQQKFAARRKSASQSAPDSGVKSKKKGDCTKPSTAALVGTKLWMCKGYELGMCKRLPEDCKYAHHVQELNPALNHDEPCRKQQCQGRLRYERRKTAMCQKLLETGCCKLEGECYFAHSLDELRSLPKHELCSKHGGGAVCLPRYECVYAHSREELRPPSPQRSSRNGVDGGVFASKPDAKELQPSTAKPQLPVAKPQPSAAKPQPSAAKLQPPAAWSQTSAAKPQLSAAKSQPSAAKPQPSAAKPQSASAKKEVHPEPCTRQHCPGRLAYETRCTKLCSSVGSGVRCNVPNCNKAHCAENLRPLPKYEMCSKYGGTKKCMPASQCPYAHSKDEQRVRPSSSAAAKGGKTMLKQKQPVAAAAVDGRNTPWRLAAEECLICFEQMSDPMTLECGHNRFHFYCISKWVNEGRPNCPCCNHPIELPDMFTAPAGLSASDFPSLPL